MRRTRQASTAIGVAALLTALGPAQASSPTRPISVDIVFSCTITLPVFPQPVKVATAAQCVGPTQGSGVFENPGGADVILPVPATLTAYNIQYAQVGLGGVANGHFDIRPLTIASGTKEGETVYTGSAHGVFDWERIGATAIATIGENKNGRLPTHIHKPPPALKHKTKAGAKVACGGDGPDGAAVAVFTPLGMPPPPGGPPGPLTVQITGTAQILCL